MGLFETNLLLNRVVGNVIEFTFCHWLPPAFSILADVEGIAKDDTAYAVGAGEVGKSGQSHFCSQIDGDMVRVIGFSGNPLAVPKGVGVIIDGKDGATVLALCIFAIDVENLPVLFGNAESDLGDSGFVVVQHGVSFDGSTQRQWEWGRVGLRICFSPE